VSFFRTVAREAQERPDLKLAITLEGIPLYIHESLLKHFETHPLILTSRGPRLAIETDPALAELESALLRELASKHDEQ